MSRFLTISFLIGAVLASLGLHSHANAETAILAADENLQWYRGNMHTHSHWSDGDDYLETIALWYRENDYNFLVFTDHNVLPNTVRWVEVEKTAGGVAAYEKLIEHFGDSVDQRTNSDGKQEVRLCTFEEVSELMNEDGEYLLIQGEEISARFEKLPIHLNVSNLEEVIPPVSGQSVYETIQNNIRAALAQKERTGEPMIVHVNHPNFGYAITAEDLMLIRGDRFFEVYNGHPAVNNAGDEHHAGTERMWDIILTRRLTEFELPIMFGLAVDDSHNYHNTAHNKSNPGRGWVMVLANELTTESLIEALERGDFYSTSGVTLNRIEVSDAAISVDIEPVEGETYTIEFIGTRAGFDPTSHPVLNDEGQPIRATRRYSSDVGETLATVTGTTATYEFGGDEIYVRARITSSAAHPNGVDPDEKQQAWCQPIAGPALAAEQTHSHDGDQPSQ